MEELLNEENSWDGKVDGLKVEVEEVTRGEVKATLQDMKGVKPVVSRVCVLNSWFALVKWG